MGSPNAVAKSITPNSMRIPYIPVTNEHVPESWPPVPKNFHCLRIETLFPPRIAKILQDSFRLSTVGDLLADAPRRIMKGRNLGTLTMRNIWDVMEKLAGGQPKASVRKVNVDVTRIPDGFVAISHPQREPGSKSVKPNFRWLGKVSIQTAAQNLIVQTLTDAHLLPDGELFAELEREVFGNIDTSQLFAFTGTYGLLSIEFVWNEAGGEIFIQIKARPTGSKMPTLSSQAICHKSEAEFLHSFLESEMGCRVRRVASAIDQVKAAIDRVKEAGIPEEEIVTFLEGRLPILARNGARETFCPLSRQRDKPVSAEIDCR